MKPLNPVALAAAAVLQVALVGGVLAWAKAPLIAGDEIVVDVHPVDPRSLFRGNYAALSYGFNVLPAELLTGLPDRSLRGERVYVRLEQEGETWRPTAATLERPESGRFLRGRVQWGGVPNGHLRVEYGVEAFFAPTEEALELERRVRSRDMEAVLRVAPSGRVGLVDVRAAE